MVRITYPTLDDITEQLKPGGLARVDVPLSVVAMPSMTDPPFVDVCDDGYRKVPSMADAPFHCPPDTVLDLPVPPSVNRTRKINWAYKRKVDAWKNICDEFVLVAKRRVNSPLKLTKIPRFELTITLSEAHTRIDLDAGLKALIDYLRRIEVVEDDSPKHMRRLVVEWGYAPFGCRVTVKACS